MSKLLDIYRKQGGAKLLNDYWKAGVFFYACFQILLTGFSKKSLEIVRLGVHLKIRNKLQRKYIWALRQFDAQCAGQQGNTRPSRKVWVCWMQGMENAPPLVQACYGSLKAHLKDREIILITSRNRADYVVLPSYIEEKYRKGIISHTHFSDLLRVELLCKYGGTWIDSTVFCSGGPIPDYVFDSPFFVFQNLKPGSDGGTLNLSSWFITSGSQYKLMLAVRHLLWTYWQQSDRLIDYFLLHHFFSIVADYYPQEWKQIYQYPNSIPHILLLSFFEPYDEKKWESLRQTCPFHKLSYKFSEEQKNIKGTYYEYFMTHGDSIIDSIYI